MIPIGVTACFFPPDPGRAVFGAKTLLVFERDMARYLARKDALPVLLPDLEGDLLETTLDCMAGFVLQGGTDVAPASYGETPLFDGRFPGDRYRDNYELKILDHALRRGKPVLGICRGCQIINVYFGGTLIQDIAMEGASKIVHRDAAAYDRIHHDVDIKAGGILADVYGREARVTVNSVHHQAIKTLGRELAVEAVCPDDGLIEAVSRTGAGGSFILGVQWHPEFSATLGKRVIAPEPLYDRFLAEVRNENRRGGE